MINSSFKTLTLSGAEEEVEFLNHFHYFHLQNLSADNVKLSLLPNIDAAEDGVITIPSGGSATIHSHNDRNKFYISGTGNVNVIATDSDNNPYQTGSSGSGGGGGSTIVPSKTNGKLNVDGSDITVYDDTEVKGLITDVQNDIPDISNLVDETKLAEAIEDVEGMIPDISNLAKQESVTAVSDSVTALSKTVQTISDSVDGINDKVGVAEGIAQLDDTGKVPAAQLPSYVDDVEEVEDIKMKSEGEGGKIYVDLLTNKTFRWTGSNFVEISTSDVVTKSSKNGYIKINNTDVQVFNDQELKTAILNLATKEMVCLTDERVDEIMKEALNDAAK